jgi:hypothetical protein
MARVRQSFPANHIDDVAGETARRLIAAGLKNKIKPGARVAITAGSRGMGGFPELVTGIISAVRRSGGQRFLIPAMGSHGGANPQGQTEILRRLGIAEDSVGAPVHATMETVALGRAENGATAHMDKLAIVLGRVKTHPESAEELASGLLKMCTIGLGKQRGAQEAHSHRLWDSVRAVPRLQLEKTKILFGVAVVENAFRQPVEIEVVPPHHDAFLEADQRLLKITKAHLGTIPLERPDLLIVDEIGKNITGSGMDLNVIGRWRTGNGPKIPDFKRIVALSLTAPSLGNGLGIGRADFTTRRFFDSYDSAVSYVNLLTAMEPDSTTREGPMPMALPSDRDAIEVGLYSSLPGNSPRVCRIRNTTSLEEIQVSESMLQQVRESPKLSLDGPAGPPRNDAAGNLF